MKNSIGLVLLFLIAFQLKAQQPPSDTSVKSLIKKIDDYLISVAQANRFNGCALIAKKGKVLLQKSYGWKNYETHTPNDTNCIFQIASLTKTFTSAIILKLQESGKLSVKDKVDKYLPDFPNGKKVTVENLLTHTSGIGNIDIEETDTITWTPMDRAEILNAFQNEPLAFKPGTEFTYRNSGYFLLGLIIEKVTGMTYQKAVRKIIFEPLQMTHSGFDFINLNDTLKATGYTILTQEKQTMAHLIDSTVTFASGDIYSTTSDLYKWAKAIAKKQILSKNSWRQTFTPFPLKEKYGYGWFTGSINNKKCVWHGGALFGFASNLTYFPDEDVTIILLNNVLNESNQQVLPVNPLSAIIFNKPYSLFKEKIEIKINDEDLNKFTGTYSLSTTPSAIMVITKKDGKLMLLVDKNTTLQFVFNTTTNFEFRNVSPGEITGQFIIEHGKTLKMIISQNGKFEWKKIK